MVDNEIYMILILLSMRSSWRVLEKIKPNKMWAEEKSWLALISLDNKNPKGYRRFVSKEKQ